MNIYTPLLEFCSTDRQTEILAYLPEGHTQPQASNAWATGMGYVSQLGTMKAITYCKEFGEKSRTMFNVAIADKD